MRRALLKFLRTVPAALCAVLLGCIQPSTEEPPPPGPWIAAAAVARDTERDIQKNDVPGIKDHVPALEEVLAEAVIAFPPPPAADGAVILLTDGEAETSATRAAAGTQRVRVVDNPYPRIGFYLATYYDNNGRPRDALRALDLGLKLTSGTGNLGQNLPSLYSEKGFALEILKRWADGLQTCQAGLALAATDSKERSKLYHCTGYCLNELGRLSEAETAYRAATLLNPDDKAAAIELQYVRDRAASQR